MFLTDLESLFKCSTKFDGVEMEVGKTSFELLVVSIGIFISQFACFHTVEYVRSYWNFLLMTSYVLDMKEQSVIKMSLWVLENV